ncbi:MAG: phosphopentomutase [bacterium]
MPIRRVCLIVLDSVGIGAMPDAAEFGDAGAHTLKHTAEAMGGLRLPALESLGLGKVDAIPGLSGQARPGAYYGKMAERSKAKDTTTGHWELAGVVSEDPPRLYPQGFPPALIAAFEAEIGRKSLGNVAASGTVIIQELGEEHLRSGAPIVYTSADSVFQIACHEGRVPIEELYRYCEIARRLCDGYRIGRVIARPFAGEPGKFFRTPRRRDLAMPPPAETVLERLETAGVPVIGVGKIGDIFSERGMRRSYHTQSNPEGIAQTLRSLAEEREGLIFVNLVDFDMLYGHRRDPRGYAGALAEFDAALARILTQLGPDDLLLISADHGCDPTYLATTDHTREYVPLLAYAPGSPGGGSLGIRDSFADVGATLAEVFRVTSPGGRSFLADLGA